MNLKKVLKTMGLATLLTGMAFVSPSCSDDKNDEGPVQYGTLTGQVTDEFETPIEGVSVTTDDPGATTATTNSQGVYKIENLSVGSHIVTFTKDDYQSVSVTIVADKFNNDLIAMVNPNLAYAAAKIRGTVVDSSNGGAPLAGATVSISESQKAVTAADGTYEIGNLPLADYTVTYEKEGYATIVKKIKVDQFVDGVAVMDLAMGGTEILRGLTIDDLREAEKWYYNEYRGGRAAEHYPHWDWACNYMCTLDFRGDWDEQNEGTTLRIRNSKDDQKNNPVDMEVFDSFVFGSKLITADNKVMTVQARTHNASDDAPAYWGVQVVDLSDADPKAKLIGGVRTLASEPYQSFAIDLSEYIDKEVIIAIGTFRQQEGDYWKQFVLRRIAFAKEGIDGWEWLPGTEVPGLDDWKMTMEMVRSTMPHTKSVFTGISPESGNRDSYVNAYRSWRAVDHVAAEWSFMPVKKDPEVFPSEGYLIKTRGSGTPVNTVTPESYFYAKFSIAAGHNQFTLKTRNFGSNYTFFKLTAIQNDGTVTHLQPISNTAQEAAAAPDGCWKFKHDSGSAGDPDAYASFVYDLSQFDGQDVVLAIGVFKGEDNGDESKLLLYNMTIN